MVKKILLIAAFLGLAINLLSGFNVIRRYRQSTSAMEWVRHSYQVLQKIDAIKLQILEAEIGKKSLVKVEDQIADLHQMVSDMPTQLDLAQKLTLLAAEDLRIPEEQHQAHQLLGRMSSNESTLLSSRLQAAFRENESSMESILVASAFDIFLIFVFVDLFFYERKKSQRLQAILAKTLNKVEEANQQMRHALETDQARFKTVVHDLKNPLGSIRGFAELIHEGSGDRNSVLQMAEIIQRVSANTLNLVGTVLQDVKQIEPSKNAVLVSECLEEVCLCLGPLAQEKNQKIELTTQGCQFSLIGVHQHVVDIFFNVIGNALKFSPRGSRIHISCNDANSYHEIHIRDEGPGFQDTDFKKLFTAGAQLSARPTGNESSTGIGLYSVKKAIDELDAEIHIRNNPDRGACVTLRFPLREQPPLEAPAYLS